MQTNAAFIASASLVLIMPVAVLIPAVAFPVLTNGENNFYRVVAGYVLDLLFGIGLILVFFGSGIEPPWQDPVSNTITFAGLFILYLLVACSAFWVMSLFRSAHDRADSRPA